MARRPSEVELKSGLVGAEKYSKYLALFTNTLLSQGDSQCISRDCCGVLDTLIGAVAKITHSPQDVLRNNALLLQCVSIATFLEMQTTRVCGLVNEYTASRFIKLAGLLKNEQLLQQTVQHAVDNQCDNVIVKNTIIMAAAQCKNMEMAVHFYNLLVKTESADAYTFTNMLTAIRHTYAHRELLRDIFTLAQQQEPLSTAVLNSILATVRYQDPAEVALAQEVYEVASERRKCADKLTHTHMLHFLNIMSAWHFMGDRIGAADAVKNQIKEILRKLVLTGVINDKEPVPLHSKDKVTKALLDVVLAEEKVLVLAAKKVESERRAATQTSSAPAVVVAAPPAAHSTASLFKGPKKRRFRNDPYSLRGFRYIKFR